MEIVNKKANFNYYIEDEIECGIELQGTEIKSIRKGSADLKDTFAVIKNNECQLLNMYIAKYKEGNQTGQESLSDNSAEGTEDTSETAGN